MRYFSYKTNCGILIFSLLFICPAIVPAQKMFDVKGSNKDNVAAVNEWVGPVMKKEFPNLDSTQIIPFANSYDNIVAALLSDMFFLPVFGESYNKMGEEKLLKIGDAMKDCIDSRKLQGKTGWIPFVYAPFLKNNSAYFIQKILVQSPGRARYMQMMKMLSDENKLLSESEYNTYNNGLIRNYFGVMNHEMKQLKELLLAAYTKGANIEGRKDFDAALNNENSPEAAAKLSQLLKDMTDGMKAITPELKAEMRPKLHNKLQTMLQELMQEEENKINALPKGDAGIEPGNEFYVAFKKRYQPVKDELPVSTTMAHYITVRLQTLQQLQPNIEDQIAKAGSLEELDLISKKYIWYPDYYIDGIKHRIMLTVMGRKDKINADMATVKAAADAKAKETALNRMGPPEKRLNFTGIFYQEAFEYAYIKDFNSLKELSQKDPYAVGLMFKLLLHEISDGCQASLPADRKRYDIISRDLVRTDYIGVYPYRTRKDIYEDRILKTVYLHPKYYDTYKNLSIGPSFGVMFLEGILDQNKFLKKGQELIDEGNTITAGANRLIALNGCKHPGINIILDNLQELLTVKKNEAVMPKINYEDAEFRRDYTYIKEGNYYRQNINSHIARIYKNAPPKLVPDLIFPPDSNTTYVTMLVQHAQKNSPGILQLSCHMLNLSTLDDGKYLNKADPNKYNLPADIDADYRKNYKFYYVIEIDYNQLHNGVIEQKHETYWFDKGTLPPAAFQEFLNKSIKKPISKVNLQYEVND